MRVTATFRSKQVFLWGLTGLLLFVAYASRELAPAAANGLTAPQVAQPIIGWEEDQLRPAVAFGDGLGQHAVVWEDHHWAWGADSDIYGQRLDRAGNKVGGLFGVSWDGSEHRLSPAIAYDRYWQRFLVSWEYVFSETDHDIYARLVGSDASLITDETPIATSSAVESAPAVAYNYGSGEYLVVWQRQVGDDEFAHNDIYARRMGADGNTVGTEFVIASTTRDERAPAVAVDAVNDRYFVVWSERSLAGDYDIYGQRVSASGSLVGGKVAISTWSYDQSNPRLTFGSLTGQFLVVWQDHHWDVAGGWDINAQRVDTGGNLYGSQIVIAGDGETQDMLHPDVAYNARANAYIVTWERVLNGTDHDIYRRFVGSTGSMVRDPVVVTLPISKEAWPAVSSADDLAYQIAWEDGRNSSMGVDIYGEALTIDLPQLTGHVFEGDIGEVSNPLSGVPVALYCSNNSGQQGTLVGETTTNVNGAYQLVAADVCGYYNIVETDPTGYTSAGATSIGGSVVNPNWIQYTGPLTTQDRNNNRFWDQPPTENADCDSCEDCSAKLDGSYDVVRLTTDLTDVSGECVLFGADHTTFDCQGHAIEGENADEFSYGVRIEGHSGNTIRNCTISGPESGISLINAYDSQILTNTVTSSRSGIHLSNSHNNTLSGNQLGQNQYGVLLASSDANNLTGNTICKQQQQDIYAPHPTSGNTRSANKCDFILNWNGDERASVCDQSCTPNVPTTCSDATNCQAALNGDFSLVTLTKDLTIPAGLNVAGNHLTLDCAGHTIAGAESGAGVLIDNRIGVGVRNCTIEGFGAGVELRSSFLCTIQTNDINLNRVGVRLGASDPLIEVQDNTISNNSLGTNNLYGLVLDDASENNITSNVITNNGLYGLWVTSDACNNTVTGNFSGGGGSLFYWHDNPSAGTVPVSSYGQVVLCNVANAVVENLNIDNGTNGGDGILLVDVSASQVRGNTLANTNGIAAYESDGVAIHHNTVSASLGDGISLDGSPHGEVYTNTLYNNADAGIALLAGADDVDVYDNTIRDNQHGISIVGADDTYLHDNRIRANSDRGVNVTLASGTTLVGNALRRNAYGLFFENDSDSTTANDNDVCYNTASDIYDNGISNTGNGNTCADSYGWSDNGIVYPNEGCDRKCVGYYQYNYGYSFHNDSKSILSHGCAFNLCQGDYVDTFGAEKVFITAPVCIGLPLCVPFVGCYCLGYEARVPTPFPDPGAEAVYWGFYRYAARPGECTGFSNTSLRFFYRDRYPSQYQSDAHKASDLTYRGALENAIDASQGAIASWQLISRYLNSINDYAQWGSRANQVLNQVKAAVDSNQLGSLLIHHVTSAHTVVATNYRDYGDTARIFIYDSNIPMWSTQYGTKEDDYPYIEIDKIRNTWWYTERPDDNIILFLPYSVSNGDLDIPGSVHQIIQWGSADAQVEDEGGNRLGWMDGTFLNEIPGAAPMPSWGSGEAQDVTRQHYLLPLDDYTVHITGKDASLNTVHQTGVYTTAVFAEDSMVLLQDVAAGPSTDDTLSLFYRPGDPPIPSVALATLDAAKPFSLTLSAGFRLDTIRVYAIQGGTLTPGGPLLVRVSDDYEALIVTNRGPDALPYGVRLQNSIVRAKEQLDGDLPAAVRSGLVIRPMETHVLRPADWLNLEGSEISTEVLACGDGTCSVGEEIGNCPEDCTAAACVVPYDDLVVNTSTLLCPGTYSLVDVNEDGVIRIAGDGVTVDCGGAKLVGDGTGIGILSAGSEAPSVKSCRVEGYAYGMRLQDVSAGQISASSVTSSTVWAVEASGTDGAQIHQNVIMDNANGVRIAMASGTGLSENLICYNTSSDVSAEGSSGSAGSHNVCSSASGWVDQGAEGCTWMCAVRPGDWRALYLPLMAKGW